MTFFLKIIRFIIGCVFTVSGLLKSFDPKGFEYKIEEYFANFGIQEAETWIIYIAIFLITVEFLIGLSLLFNVFPKFGLHGTALCMLIFVPLTLYVALSADIEDCGCFGERLRLTDWQSFGKNIVISLLLIPLYIKKEKLVSGMYIGGNILMFAGGAVLILILCLYSYKIRPVLGAQEYSIGRNLNDKGFMKMSWNGQYENVFNSNEYIFLVISSDLKNISEKTQNEINRLSVAAMQAGNGFYGATSLSKEISDKYRSLHNIPYDFVIADETALKNIVRSDIGIVLTKNGVIYEKWEGNKLPDEKTAASPQPDSPALSRLNDRNERKDIAIMLLSVLFIWNIIYNGNKKKKFNRYI